MPSVILIPDTFMPSDSFAARRSSLLLDYIEEEFPDIPLEPIARKQWNETLGVYGSLVAYLF